MTARVLICFLAACLVVVVMLVVGTRYFVAQNRTLPAPSSQQFLEVEYLTPAQLEQLLRDEESEEVPQR